MRTRRIYVASSWRNPDQPGIVAGLRADGHEVYDFRNPAPNNTGFSWRKIRPEPPPWSAESTREVLEHDVAERGFQLDFEAMLWADTIVMVQPCGRSAALELGWGCGARKHTFALLADGQEPELMLKCADVLCTSYTELAEALASTPFPTMDFGGALTALKSGFSVRRETWSRGQWIRVVGAHDGDPSREPSYPVSSHIEARSLSGWCVPWTPTHEDILATNWTRVVGCRGCDWTGDSKAPNSGPSLRDGTIPCLFCGGHYAR